MTLRRLLAVLASFLPAPAAAEQVGLFSDHADVGEVARAGSVELADGPTPSTTPGPSDRAISTSPPTSPSKARVAIRTARRG